MSPDRAGRNGAVEDHGPLDVTTVADDLIEIHAGCVSIRRDGLSPATEYTINGTSVTTLARPDGELLCRFGTVNDVHFGELECGRIEDNTQGPILRSAPGDAPYPETMNRGAVAEMRAADLEAVVVKGDLSNDGLDTEWSAFEVCYRPPLGERLHVVRGNHDGYHGQHEYAGDEWIELPGIAIALLDTVIPERTTGTLSVEQLDWLDAHAAEADRPVFVMGHHQQWIEGHRSDDYFGLHPDASEALDAVCARRRGVIAYAAGHTHRHRVREMPSGVPSIEVGCVKDFPGV